MRFASDPFAFQRPPGLDGPEPRHPVIVVGAGPVGLTAALDIAQRGVPVVVLDRRDRIINSSRAAAIRRRSMQVFDRIGVGDAIARQALTFSHSWSFYGTRQIDEITITADPHEKHPDILLLQQCWIERLLLDKAIACGVDVRWHSQVVAAQAGQGGAVLGIETPAGGYALSGSYVVAADGAHSDVRRLLGLKYEGQSFEQRWSIVDFHMPSSLPAGRRVWFDPPCEKHSTTLMHRMPFDVWRLDYLIHDGQDAEAVSTPGHAKERVRKHLAMMGVSDPWTLLDTSVYRPNALSMPSYRSGPFFFIGDAAHLLPIFSGRGMNHGIEDAGNLGWKLAEVLAAGTNPCLLDSFDAERRPAVLATLKDLSNTTVYMNAASKGVRLLREAMLSLAIREPFARALFEPLSIAESRYPDSPLNTPCPGNAGGPPGPAPGTTLPDFPVILATSQTRCSLHDVLSPGFCCLFWTCGMDAGQVRQALDAVRQIDRPVPIVLVQDAAPATVDTTCIDADGLGRQRLGGPPGACYLIRPDRVIAARWTSLNATDIRRALEAARGIPTTNPN